MKTPWLVGIVVAAHCAVVGSVALIQGCGTVAPASDTPDDPIMPQAMGADAMSTYPGPGSRTPSGRPAKSWPTETTSYVVGRGDSLSRIASRFGVSMAEIMALNGIRNPDVIRLGQKLTLPGKLDVRKAPPPRQRAKAAPVADGPTYIVKAGDSLSRIASRNGTTTRAIKDANGLSGDRILIGQKLVIPGGKTNVAPPQRDVAPPRDLDVDNEPTVVAPPQRDTDAGVGAAKKTEPYVVLEGDTLRVIAMRNAVGVSVLRRINGLSVDAEVIPGQTIQIPAPE